MRRVLFVFVLAALTSSLALAQSFEETFLLRNVSGTAANPGGVPHHVFAGTGWTFFGSGSAHLTYVNEVGPDEPRNETFSTNWFTGGVHGTLGERVLFVARGRVSLEPMTIEDEGGYPQILQYIPIEAGGPTVDRMRAHDLIGEAAAHVAIRTGESSFFHVYGGIVGDPALGPVPYAQRASAVDFAEAPFSYEVQETFHDSTSVVTAGFATRRMNLEASVFHDAVTFGDHTEIDTGDIDSHSYRLTFMPTDATSLQVSRGELGEGLDQRKITSASFSWGSSRGPALTAMWTQREQLDRPKSTAYGVELALRGARNTFMARFESVERPLGFPVLGSSELDSTGHGTLGYLYDFVSSSKMRLGVGVNLDYHQNTHAFEDLYGHKPQAIYTFVRVRTQ